jgi:hypothetical protein
MQRPLLLAAFVRCVICVHAGRGTALCFCNDCAADFAMMAAAARLHALSIALEGVWLVANVSTVLWHLKLHETAFKYCTAV